MKITKHAERVRTLLTQYPDIRDNDMLLIAIMWKGDALRQGKNIDMITARELIVMMMTGRLSNAQSVRRMRRKLQEEFPELRGKKWKERHKESDHVIKDLRETPELFKGGTP